MTYFIIQTKHGVALAANWMADEESGVPILLQIDDIDWLSGGVEPTYREARRRWAHVLGR